MIVIPQRRDATFRFVTRGQSMLNFLSRSSEETHRMKTLTAAFTALALLGFAASASAQCAGYAKSAADQTAQAPIVVQQGATGS